jgi:hypothetical protein
VEGEQFWPSGLAAVKNAVPTGADETCDDEQEERKENLALKQLHYSDEGDDNGD